MNRDTQGKFASKGAITNSAAIIAGIVICLIGGAYALAQHEAKPGFEAPYNLNVQAAEAGIQYLSADTDGDGVSGTLQVVQAKVQPTTVSNHIYDRSVSIN